MTHATIKLELIADDFFWEERQRKRRGFDHRDDPVSFDRWLRQMKMLGPDKSPTWVARVLRFEHNQPKREFVNGVKNYENANRSGSRGVYCWYVLREGVYEINERYKWNKVRRYFLLSENGATHEITKNEAIEWLQQQQQTNATSASAS